MKCDVQPTGSDTYFDAFRARMIQQRIPLSGSLELTHRCNLECRHCYVKAGGSRGAGVGAECSTREVLRIVDECTKAGCLYLVFTGGEPLLRADFPEIYRRAKTNGLLVTVFTNATLVDEHTLDLFSEWPPRMVEITVYGATAATYERVSGVPGSYTRFRRGLDALAERNIPVKLKTVLMTLNQEEYAAIRDLALSYSEAFRFDANIFPRLNGDTAPLDLRLDPEDVAQLEFSDSGLAQQWVDGIRASGTGPVSDRLFFCGAAVTNFNITPDGWLQPCMMIPWIRHDVKVVGFADAWKALTRDVREAKAPWGQACSTCDRKNLCNYCPGSLRREDGSFMDRSEFHCRMGDARQRWINKMREQDGVENKATPISSAI